MASREHVEKLDVFRFARRRCRVSNQRPPLPHTTDTPSKDARITSLFNYLSTRKLRPQYYAVDGRNSLMVVWGIGGGTHRPKIRSSAFWVIRLKRGGGQRRVQSETGLFRGFFLCVEDGIFPAINFSFAKNGKIIRYTEFNWYWNKLSFVIVVESRNDKTG